MSSKYDELTGLKLDTRGLELKQTPLGAKQSDQTVGVVFVGLNHMAKWNYDNWTRCFAEACIEMWHAGGEEFLITLPMITLTAAQELAERLRGQAEQQMLAFHGQSVPSVTMTLGVACYPEHGESAEALFRAVEEAVMRGKHEGRNCVRVVAL